MPRAVPKRGRFGHFKGISRQIYLAVAFLIYFEAAKTIEFGSFFAGYDWFSGDVLDFHGLISIRVFSSA